MELECSIQNYAWGVNGQKSSVAKFMHSTSPEKPIENMPYAELWMGTHPNGPSLLKESKEPLSSIFEEFPDALGSNITSKFENQLCYLFKVLSVSQALSIQAHPNKEHAELLHKDRPQIYKDPNHKPEMAIAITPFQALCGFRVAKEIGFFLSELPELKAVVGADNVSRFISSSTQENLKLCFSSLMNAHPDIVASNLLKMKNRLVDLDEATSDIFLRDTLITLHDQYPDDRGCFSIYFLNLMQLKPGEALFLGPNIIHAYLLGDCVECMACSDNVVRAGLTPKYQDVETLVSMLEYEMSDADSRKFSGQKIDENLTLFNPPVPDFAVQEINGRSGENVFLTKESSASILIVIKGSASDVSVEPKNKKGVPCPIELKMGTVIFTEANQILSFKIASNEFLAFRALCL